MIPKFFNFNFLWIYKQRCLRVVNMRTTLHFRDKVLPIGWHPSEKIWYLCPLRRTKMKMRRSLDIQHQTKLCHELTSTNKNLLIHSLGSTPSLNFKQTNNWLELDGLFFWLFTVYQLQRRRVKDFISWVILLLLHCHSTCRTVMTSPLDLESEPKTTELWLLGLGTKQICLLSLNAFLFLILKIATTACTGL